MSLNPYLIKNKNQNPYNRFELDNNKILFNKDYSKTNHIEFPRKNLSKKIFLSKILNNTKSILKSKSDFFDYMQEYYSIVTKSTFKTPDIRLYPLLRKNRPDLISIKNQSKTVDNYVKKKPMKNYLKEKIFSSDFKKKFRINLSATSSNLKKNNNFFKEKKNEKLFFYDDFFYKWKKEENKINNEYSDLNYDENKIFFGNYHQFLEERMNFCKKNKLENLQKSLKISFEDRNKKKIKLELISMKLIFEPIKQNDYKIKAKNYEYNFEDYKQITEYKGINTTEEDSNNINNEEESNKNKNIVTFPLSYVFLYYINGFDYFKKILLSCIKFDSNFKKIYFQENEIYTIIRNEGESEQNKKDKNIIRRNGPKKNTRSFMVGGVANKLSKNNKTFFSLKSFNFSQKNEQKIDLDEKGGKINNKKILKIHSNQDIKSIKNGKYTEYNFIWETPFESYRVKLIMPIIIFWSEHINKNIITYCNKELFLFLLKNNFINWDYYILKYLFSLKIFRFFILKGISFYNKYSMSDALQKNIKNQRNRNKNKFSHINIRTFLKKEYKYIDDRNILLNNEKKIFNQFSENNESYKFFYTDNFSINSIIEINSFKILIDNPELNNKIYWEFLLNFKQMIFLTNINNYEKLENFLPKIIITNFEEGYLNLDLNILEYFNNKIIHGLKYDEKKSEKNDMNSSSSISSHNKDKMRINIKMPTIIREQFVKSDLLNNNVKEFETNFDFLNALKNYDNKFWPEKILEFLNLDINNAQIKNNGYLNMINTKNKINEDEYDDIFDKNYEERFKNNNFKNHSKSLHFRLRKHNL